jgi:F-type H+-transporting ATPase subunit b
MFSVVESESEVAMKAKKSLMPLVALAALAPPSAAMAEAAGSAEGSQPGLLDFNYSQVVWVLVIFVVLAIILYRTAWKNVLAGLKGREKRIRDDIARAEAVRADAEAILKKYNDQLATAEQRVRELFDKATADAEKLAGSIRTRGQHEAEEIKERAMHEIEAAREQALSEIYAQTADLATRVAEKILRRNLNADDQRALVNESLQELQTAGAR